MQQSNKYAAYATSSTDSTGTLVVNGQMVSTPLADSYNPASFYNSTLGIPVVSGQSVPLSVGTLSSSVNTFSSLGGNTTQSTTQRGTTSLGVIDSPAWFALILLVFGMCWLRYIHWDKK